MPFHPLCSRCRFTCCARDGVALVGLAGARVFTFVGCANVWPPTPVFTLKTSPIRATSRHRLITFSPPQKTQLKLSRPTNSTLPSKLAHQSDPFTPSTFIIFAVYFNSKEVAPMVVCVLGSSPGYRLTWHSTTADNEHCGACMRHTLRRQMCVFARARVGARVGARVDARLSTLWRRTLILS